MSTEQTELYERIKSFSLDRPDASLSFSKRLARDNGWSLQYAQQAIEEYKRFAFLAVSSGHPVTPSDAVDQVWHLHLTYTRSYWEDFCSQVLQTPLHHEPTLGGRAESQKFDDWYSKTLESYEEFFGSKPPAEIWSTPEDRFGRDLHFVRINTQQNWVVAKFRAQKGVLASIFILLALTLSGCYIDSAETETNILSVTLLSVLCIATGFGAIRFLIGIVDFVKNPRKGTWVGGSEFMTGCGSSDFGSHHSNDSGSSGGGCGGCGGCGGGGCGGCGGGLS